MTQQETNSNYFDLAEHLDKQTPEKVTDAEADVVWKKLSPDDQMVLSAYIRETQQKSEPEPDVCPHTFMFSLNANHTLVRGCIHCGETYATLVMGNVQDLQWHRIQESEE